MLFRSNEYSLRTVEDDHVDRPGVEERQRLKLTGTNSSIGLIVLITYIHPTKSDGLPALTHERPLRAYAPRGRRTTGDAQSRLRASPVGEMQTSPWHGKTGIWHKQIASSYPYSLLATA